MSLDINALRQMLAQDTAALTQLKQLLAEERQLLEQRKQDGMQEIINQKAAAVDHLSNSAKLRHQILTTLGLATNAAGWDIFLQRNALTLPMRDDWKNLLNEFAECQKMNDVNGKMIARSQQTINHLLNLLRGKVPAPSLYTAKGTQTQQATSYTVAKA